MKRTTATEEFWAAYKAAAKLMHDRYTVVEMGDSPDVALEPTKLMLAGTKRATASLVRDFEITGKPLPQPGDYVIVVDSACKPRCIWQTIEVTIKPLIEVDEAFAWDECEGDRVSRLIRSSNLDPVGEPAPRAGSGENTRRGRPRFYQATMLAKIAATIAATLATVLIQSIMPADPRNGAVQEATPSGR